MSLIWSRSHNALTAERNSPPLSVCVILGVPISMYNFSYFFVTKSDVLSDITRTQRFS